MAAIVNERELRVFAMKRSGHHAVVHWLLLHFEGPVYFLNNCGFVVEAELFNFSPGCDAADRSSPFVTQAVFAGTSSVVYDGGRELQKTRHYTPGRAYASTRERLEAMAEAERAAALPAPARRECYLFNLEDLDLRQVASVPFAAAARGESQTVQPILIVRDPFNWLASRLKGGFSVARPIIEAWKSHLHEALGHTQLLTPRPVVINYNRWHLEAAYRRAISTALGLAPSERGLDEVSDFGEGSSFDRRAFDGRGREMPVLERWQAYRADSRFRELFEADPELAQLSEAYFQFNPLTDG